MIDKFIKGMAVGAFARHGRACCFVRRIGLQAAKNGNRRSTSRDSRPERAGWAPSALRLGQARVRTNQSTWARPTAWLAISESDADHDRLHKAFSAVQEGGSKIPGYLASGK
jgi:hypothetical protein